MFCYLALCCVAAVYYAACALRQYQSTETDAQIFFLAFEKHIFED